jgi:hypothetical protein
MRQRVLRGGLCAPRGRKTGKRMATSTLTQAKKNKADEFYTQMPDIEAEVRHYRDQFEGKSVLCNCDDPYESHFFKYFALNFNFLKLRKLVATCYAGSSVMQTELPLYDVYGVAESDAEARNPYKIEITEVVDTNADGTADLVDVAYLLRNKKNVLTVLKGDGDFRSPECVELMRQTDIVVTNPPFSLFLEFMAQLMALDKKFLIIGSKNAITYLDIFSLIKEDKLWMGHGFPNGNAFFRVPDAYDREWAAGVFDQTTGLVKFRNVSWFTNLDVSKRHEFLTLYRNYTPEEYPRYANYDAIEVSKVSEIPCDYDGEMGVPITFLDKYNPDQFEIIGSSRFLGRPMSEIAPKGTYVAGGIRFYLPKGDGTYRRLYDRIVIRRKKRSAK